MPNFVNANLSDAIELVAIAGKTGNTEHAENCRRKAVEILRAMADRLEESYTTTFVPEGGAPTVEQFTFSRGDGAKRATVDLRARGFKVAEDQTGLTILVQTPAGWTGTAAHDVARAHKLVAAQRLGAPVGDIVFGA